MRQFILFIIFIAAALELQAQGCSDAGVCKLGSLKPDPNYTKVQHDNLLDAGFSVGAADYGVTVFGGHIGYSRQFGENWSIDTKATFLSQNGNEVSVIGLGDIFANINY